jgi:hypothetical protein
VIVHGGWGGGWEWTEVARSLRERGHDVFTPTLTGMGERAHLGHPQVGLSTHVEDVVAVTGAIDSVGRAFVRCTGDELGHDLGGDPIVPAAARARREGWLYRELVAPHDPQLADPVGTATALHELTATARIEPEPR